MGKKGIGVIIIVLVIILALIAVYQVSESPGSNSEGMTELNVSSEGPFQLSDLISLSHIRHIIVF